MAVAANNNLELASLDIRAAFLYAKVFNREIYMRPPADIWKPRSILKLNNPLYGSDDASRKFCLKSRRLS